MYISEAIKISILTSTKKKLGIEEEYELFDLDIIDLINTAFSVMNQMGIGPTELFQIEDKNSKWEDFSDNASIVSMAKSYVPMKVKMLWDAPENSSVSESYNEEIEALEWRMYTLAGQY